MTKLIKIIIVAFILSIAIHSMMYFIINKNLNHNTLKMNTSNKKSDSKKGLVNIKYVKLKKIQQKKNPIKQTETTVKKKILKKPQVKKSIVKKKTITPKKTIPKIKLPVIKKEPIDLKKFFVVQKQDNIQKNEENKKNIKKQKEIKEIQKLSPLTQSYIKLYGEQYFEFSEIQRKYLKQNLNKIGKITQRHLKYPSLSIRTRQQGTNVVEFYFHPNGDISELKLNNSSYFTALDENTLETIRIAYQHYPKPLEKVKIIIFVRYILN